MIPLRLEFFFILSFKVFYGYRYKVLWSSSSFLCCSFVRKTCFNSIFIQHPLRSFHHIPFIFYHLQNQCWKRPQQRGLCGFLRHLQGREIGHPSTNTYLAFIMKAALPILPPSLCWQPWIPKIMKTNPLTMTSMTILMRSPALMTASNALFRLRSPKFLIISWPFKETTPSTNRICPLICQGL